MNKTHFFPESRVSVEMSKDHSKKQLITDIAISKVPLIRYPGLPTEAYPLIQNFSKETLRISQQQNDSNEVSIVFSLRKLTGNLNPVFGVAFGDEHTVNPEDSIEAYHLLHSEPDCVLVLTHNHPATATFSLDDIYYFLRQGNIKLMLAISNAGKIYYMVRSTAYSYELASELAHQTTERVFKARTISERITATCYFLHNCRDAGIIYGDH